MKLRFKKNSNAVEKKVPIKAAENKPAHASLRFLKLIHYTGIALIVVFFGALLQAALVDLTALAPAESKQTQLLNTEVANVVAERVNQRMDFALSAINKWVKATDISEVIDQPIFLNQSETILATTLPYVDRVIIKKSDEFKRATSFASLDLVKRVGQGKTVSPEIFLTGKEWKIQIAVPFMKDAQVEAVMLVVFNADLVKKVLGSPKGLPTGKLSVLQKVAGIDKEVLYLGQGTAEQVKVNTSIAGWAVAFQSNQQGNIELIARSNYWMMALVFALVSLLAATVPLVMMLRRVRTESIKVTQFTQYMITGERKAAPEVKLDFFFTMVATFQRISANMTKERAAQAKEAATIAAASPTKHTAGQADKEGGPLFQEDDVLDINMFEGDDDLLGLNDLDDAGTQEDESEDAGFLNDMNNEMLQEIDRVDVPQGIFRAYDIRGIVGETLTEAIVEQIGLALGTEALARQQTTLCVGYDGRSSSPVLAKALMSGITRTGCHVINVGRVPTPVLYFATHQLETGSGVMITGSHNPANYNGLKMVLDGETLSNESIQKLYQRIDTQNYSSGQGDVSEQSVSQAYLDVILNDIAVAAPLKVVVDAGNGIAGELGPQLIEELGCEVIPLYCEVDGTFPNHHPDPSKSENLADLIKKVEEEGADIGIAFDGDGDRLGVVTNKGKIIYSDRLLMLFAKDVVSRNPGADVIFDVKCTRRLNGLISGYGGRPIMWKTGHSLIKAKMKETGALLAGEMSGHIFFKERWYGFDDGLYSAARLLEILGIDERSSEMVFNAFPEDISTPELNIDVTDETKFELIQRLGDIGLFGDGSISKIDGIRVDYADGWGLCRASNTTPVLVLRFEADTEEALERIKQVFREQLIMVDPDININF